mmetsp:Transcript_42197/g.68456  ORF Transcript_42197/g.68456 Transcript_42197/m.68456 type:complete len:89 (+) Transcript_42197:360-626(+)
MIDSSTDSSDILAIPFTLQAAFKGASLPDRLSEKRFSFNLGKRLAVLEAALPQNDLSIGGILQSMCDWNKEIRSSAKSEGMKFASISL